MPISIVIRDTILQLIETDGGWSQNQQTGVYRGSQRTNLQTVSLYGTDLGIPHL